MADSRIAEDRHRYTNEANARRSIHRSTCRKTNEKYSTGLVVGRAGAGKEARGIRGGPTESGRDRLGVGPNGHE